LDALLPEATIMVSLKVPLEAWTPPTRAGFTRTRVDSDASRRAKPVFITIYGQRRELPPVKREQVPLAQVQVHNGRVRGSLADVAKVILPPIEARIAREDAALEAAKKAVMAEAEAITAFHDALSKPASASKYRRHASEPAGIKAAIEAEAAARARAEKALVLEPLSDGEFARRKSRSFLEESLARALAIIKAEKAKGPKACQQTLAYQGYIKNRCRAVLG